MPVSSAEIIKTDNYKKALIDKSDFENISEEEIGSFVLGSIGETN